MVKRNRRVHSVSDELLTKSREAALSAVQIFNSPLIVFKAETFIVLMNIAWTYLLHAYYRKQKIEYRYYENHRTRRRFAKTKHGADKHWELERCLDDKESPIDKGATNNLRFLIGVRHEIEHQMTSRLDASMSAKFQACCLNYNDYIKTLFGDGKGIDQHLSFSLQFSSISADQARSLPSDNVPGHIRAFIDGFENNLSDVEYNNPKFAHRVLFVAKTANRRGQADEVIEFVKAGSDLASDVNKTYALIKETERPKHLPGTIVRLMKQEGFTSFSMHSHTELWKNQDARKAGKPFGVKVGNTWYWYDKWVEVVRQYCKENTAKDAKTKP